MDPLYYRTPYTEDPDIPEIPGGARVVHLPHITTADGGQKATCHCDYDMVDPRCVRLHTPVVPATEEDEQWLIKTYGKTSEELADEAERGYDPAKFVPHQRKK